MRTGDPTPDERAILLALLLALQWDDWEDPDQGKRILRVIRVHDAASKRALASAYEAGRIAAVRAQRKRERAAREG